MTYKVIMYILYQVKREAQYERDSFISHIHHKTDEEVHLLHTTNDISNLGLTSKEINCKHYIKIQALPSSMRNNKSYAFIIQQCSFQSRKASLTSVSQGYTAFPSRRSGVLPFCSVIGS